MVYKLPNGHSERGPEGVGCGGHIHLTVAWEGPCQDWVANGNLTSVL